MDKGTAVILTVLRGITVKKDIMLTGVWQCRDYRFISSSSVHMALTRVELLSKVKKNR